MQATFNATNQIIRNKTICNIFDMQIEHQGM